MKNLFKNDDVKPLIITVFIITAIMLIIFCVISIIEINYYKNVINNSNAAVITAILKDNPEIPEEEIIKEMTNTQDIQLGLNTLEKYGASQLNPIISNQLQGILNKKILLSIAIILIYTTIVSTYIFLFIKQRYKRIDNITEYIKNIENRVYDLDIRDNDEGEISKLKNELYKITVALKEQAEISKVEKLNLSNAISDISHQIKTPITSLMIIIDILYNDKSIDEEKQEEFLREIKEQLEWIKDLVLSLLKLSKLDVGVTELKNENVNVKNLIDEVLKNLSIPIEIKKHEIEVIGNIDVNFKGDISWSKEAILNIVKNCIEHTNENGKIVISFIENALYTEIKIIDNGSGISKEDLPYIFNRFYKAKNSSKESIGIGLAISKSIIERQNGKIYVKSKLQEGTEFKIQFFKDVI